MTLEVVMSNVIQAFVLMVIVSLIVERSLATLFGWSVFAKYLGDKGVKVPITMAVCWMLCRYYPFDATAIIFAREPSFLGMLLTAGFLAGGSKYIAETFGDLKKAVSEIKES